MSTLGSDMDARRRLLEQRLRKAQAGQPETPRIAKRPDDAGTPLSSIQRRLWFLDQWQPGSAAYNVPVALALQGQVDTERLERALRDVARQHEVLRTTYRDEGGQPVAVVHPEHELGLRVIDARAGQSPEELIALATSEAGVPFALDRELPLRAVLWRSRADDSLLLINLHHIAADGWSVGVLLRELGKVYDAGRAGHTDAD